MYVFGERLHRETIRHQASIVLAFCFMEQMSVKAALKKWGNDADTAGVAEASQLHWRKTFIPRKYVDLTPD